MRFYGLDLREEVRNTPPRRLLALICGLPPDSALARIEFQEAHEDEDKPHVITSLDEFGSWINKNA